MHIYITYTYTNNMCNYTYVQPVYVELSLKPLYYSDLRF